MSVGLTKRQAQALAFIRSYIEANGYSPTYRDIQTALALRSKSGVHRLVHRLAERGAITHIADRHQSIGLVA